MNPYRGTEAEIDDAEARLAAPGRRVRLVYQLGVRALVTSVLTGDSAALATTYLALCMVEFALFKWISGANKRDEAGQLAAMRAAYQDDTNVVRAMRSPLEKLIQRVRAAGGVG